MLLKLSPSPGYFEQLRSNPLGLMLNLQHDEGSFACWEEDGAKIYFVFGPEGNRPVLTETDLFLSCFCPVRGPRRSAQRRLTSGLLNMNGGEHRAQRRMISPPFARRMLPAYTPAIQAHTAEMLASWRPSEVHDVRAEIGRLILRITSSVLFGIEDTELADRCGNLLDEYLIRNHEVGLAAVTNSADEDQYERLLETAERVEAGVRELIAWRRDHDPGPDLLSLLIAACDAGHVTPDQLIGHTVLTYGAAKSTTAHSIQWTLLLAAQHPEIWAELRPAIDEESTDEDGPRYLNCVIKESMRILPASVYVQRATARPTRLGPFDLPQGATVVFSQFVSHRIAEHFPEPEQFRPERWFGAGPPAYSYIPFGLGPRLCLGGSLGLHILRHSLTQIWRHCSLEMVSGTPVDLEVVATMLTSAGPLPMRIGPPGVTPGVARLGGNINEFVKPAPVAACAAFGR